MRVGGRFFSWSQILLPRWCVWSAMHTTLIALALTVRAAAPVAAPAAATDVRAAARKPLVCTTASPHLAVPKGDPETRRAAQRGLAFLASASQAWTEKNKCFGCHVQAVTVEAFAVGKHHRYDVAAEGRRRHGEGAADGRHRGRPHDRRRVRGAGLGALRPVDRRPARERAAEVRRRARRVAAAGRVDPRRRRPPARDRWGDAHDLPGDADLAAGVLAHRRRQVAVADPQGRALPRAPVRAVEQQERGLSTEHQLRAARSGVRRRRPLRGELVAAAAAAARPGRTRTAAGASIGRRATPSPPARRSTR